MEKCNQSVYAISFGKKFWGDILGYVAFSDSITHYQWTYHKNLRDQLISTDLGSWLNLLDLMKSLAGDKTNYSNWLITTPLDFLICPCILQSALPLLQISINCTAKFRIFFHNFAFLVVPAFCNLHYHSLKFLLIVQRCFEFSSTILLAVFQLIYQVK